ncbi:MAG: 5-oxoprolinase subunit PxpB [Bacillota bacterium]
MATYKCAGDKAILIEFDYKISEEINERVRRLDIAINQHLVDSIIETVPAYHSILVYYNPLLVDSKELISKLKSLEESKSEDEIPEPRQLDIPVVYGGEFGPDLKYVADHNNLTPEEVIKKHTSGRYRVYMLGFTPGFAYLGGLSDQLAAPRHNNPRGKIPAGSVGIAGSQTGIYPITSPGGWRIIGRTPLELFKPDSDQPFLFKQGDIVNFKKIDKADYQKIKK